MLSAKKSTESCDKKNHDILNSVQDAFFWL